MLASFSEKKFVFLPKTFHSAASHSISMPLLKPNFSPFPSVSKALQDGASTNLACFISQLPPLLKVSEDDLESRFSNGVGVYLGGT